MVRAILEGRKTQTRRIAKEFNEMPNLDGILKRFPNQQGCPYGEPGDRLWVRETHQYWWPDWEDLGSHPCRCRYKADDAIIDLPVEWDEGNQFFTPEDAGLDKEPHKWRPSIYMPRWASRIMLEITGVRVERLQEIREADARAEGITDGGCLTCGESEPCGCSDPKPDARDGFAWLWQSIHGTDSWHANPWVWVLEFKMVES